MSSSDDIAYRNYSFSAARSPNAKHFEQPELHSGPGHGFLHRPIGECLTSQEIDSRYFPGAFTRAPIPMTELHIGIWA
jgi:hypothetical protein